MNEIPTCREVARDLVAVAAGEAEPGAARGVERHVAICPPCRDEVVEDAAAIEPVYRELLDYLNARGTRLSWPLDLRWAKSEFQRRVLAVTTELPYGAVASYGGIAKRIGAPGSVRAVAQALRHNPLPIVIPCHRVIGSTGDLTGYAGTRIG